MRKLKLLCTLALASLCACISSAQDFSNKGKDFWVGYGYHQQMTNGGGGGTQQMVLYFAAEQLTNVTVTIPGVGYIQSYVVPANTTITSAPIPKFGAQDVRLTTESTAPENKGIHITADKPIVAYSHIYNQNVSGASILFPTNTLGKEYYSINYTNISNTGNSNCWFYVVAADTGTTTVEITPSAQTLNHNSGIPFTVNLTQGQIYNILGTYSGNSGVDLTGSKIQSINTGSGCKRIGVYSGSGRISITCTGGSSSSDNYMVQAFPKSAWGKKFLTTSTGGNQSNNIYRVCVSDPATVVTLDGGPIGVPLINGFYYELAASTTPKLIVADKPIMVAQYLTSQGACGNGNSPGDPEVIYLSPVEQNISKVLWNATPNFAITQHYYNVVIPNTGTAISSFTLDGFPVSPAFFNVHPQDPGYSYLVQAVSQGQHIIQSDSGFNAIAYGYGNAESYGYNAGTNIKDIFQYISIQNPYGTVNFPATCRGTPFNLSMTFPYQPTQIVWQFGPLLNAMGFVDVTITNGGLPIPPTSTIVVGGKTLYVYALPTPYSIPTSGTYPIRVVATNPTPDGCGGVQEIDFDVQVFDPPIADFNFTTDGCVTNPVQFTDNSNTNGRPVISRHWNFGDAITSAANNPSHTYAAAGAYNVKYTLITDIGCIADTASHIVTLNDLPVADFTVTTPNCEGGPITFNDNSTASGTSVIGQWTWNFGDGSPAVVVTTNASQTHTYATAGTYNVTLQVETTTGCQSLVDTYPITIHPKPVGNFSFPNVVCLPSGSTQFTDLSTVGAGNTVTNWLWDFGDGSPTSTTQNPVHIYAGTGPYAVTLIITTNNGCRDTAQLSINTIYAEPQAAFNSLPEVCLGSSISFTDASTAPGSTVTGWLWNFGDGSPTSTAQNPTHTYAATGTYTVTLSVTSAVGCQTVNNTVSHQVTVNPLPTVSFTSSPPYCENGSITLTSTSVPNAGTITQYTWTINGTPTGGNNATISFIPPTAGIYTVVLSVLTSKGCTDQITTPITVNPKPTSNFSFPTVVCLPSGSTQFTDLSIPGAGNTITSWLWDFGDGSPTSTLQNPVHVYAGTGPYTVTLTVNTNNGCSDNHQLTINTIYAEPQAAFNSVPAVCVGSLIGFSDASTAPGSTITGWLWNFGDGSPTSTAQNPSHTYAAPGTYTVTLTVTSAVGCQSVNNTASHTITVNPLPTGSIAGNTVVCLNAPSPMVTFTGAGTTVPYTFTYTINGGAPQTVSTVGANTSVSIPVSTATANTYTYTLVSVQDGSSTQCAQGQTGTVTVDVRPLPTASISGNTEVCLNATPPMVTFTGANGTAPYTFTYTINGGAPQTVTTVTGNSVSIPAPTGTANDFVYALVSVQEGGANLCTQLQTGSILVRVKALPTASISGNAEVCLNTPALPLVTFTGANGAAPYTFTYTINGGAPQTVTTVSGNSVTVPVPTNVANTFTYALVSVQEGSATACLQSQSGSAAVIVNPLPTGNFNFSIPSCETRTVTFTDASIPNAGALNNWQWNFGDPGSGGANTSTLQNPTHIFAATGTYNVSLTVATDKGCVDTVVIRPVTINARPRAGFISPEVCLTDPAAPFIDTSSIASGSVTAWEWNFGDPGSGGANTSTLQNPTHTYAAVGPYTATLIAISNNGCRDTIQQTFTVNGSIPVAGFTVQNPASLCSNQPVSIVDASTVNFGSVIKVEIFWDYLNDPTIKTTDDTPVPGATYTHTYPEFGSPFTRTFRVRYVAYSGINCVSSLDRDITILATPTIQFNPIPYACTEAPAFQVTQATVVNGLPGPPGVFTGPGITTTGVFTPSVAGAGLHTIRYTFTGSNGCTNYKEQTIEVSPTPPVNAGPDKVVLEGGQVMLTPAVNASLPLTYLWTPSTGLSDPTVPQPNASPADDITYTLTVTTDKGCSSSDNVFVKVLKAPAIPNIFSPNGDGVHDKWVIQFLETYPGCTVDIYNRYGQLIYHSVGYTNPWDGTVNGKQVPVGTYYYIVNPKNGRSQMSGYVDVIR